MESSQTLWNSKAGMSTSTLKYAQRQPILISRFSGTEVETAKSIDELLTSRSIVRRTDFSDCDMLDAKIASALKKLLDKHVRFRRRVSVEEQRAQKYDRFLRGKQIPFLIYEHVRATSACDAVQGLSDLFKKTLTEWRPPRFRCMMGVSTILSK